MVTFHVTLLQGGSVGKTIDLGIRTAWVLIQALPVSYTRVGSLTCQIPSFLCCKMRIQFFKNKDIIDHRLSLL